ncbi:MAG: 16S rRNA (cytosine(1402)-N(4))-methyltransferase RsmH [Deltaproteobacteria bacterium]|nr:16S rRNA (cytosine(1402)-N(4))-methyltransferase RsmH [Deltaproteobacteria bacterium]
MTLRMKTLVSGGHQPVLVEEVLRFLNFPGSRCIVDGTVGSGGHAAALLQATPSSVRLIGLDRDPEALKGAAKRLDPYEGRFSLYQASYKNLEEILNQNPLSTVDGILLDLGLSSMQLEIAERGFSFQKEGPLDMRFDPDSSKTAADLVAKATEKELSDLFWRYGEERHSRRIARAIVQARQLRPITTTRQLAELAQRTLPWQGGRRLHPATRVFQALRIAVNEELSALEHFLGHALDFLSPGGRLCILSYHSLEDRQVKEAFRRWQREGQARILTKKPIQSSESEIRNNPRARSAKLRAAEKLEPPAHGDAILISHRNKYRVPPFGGGQGGVDGERN